MKHSLSITPVVLLLTGCSCSAIPAFYSQEEIQTIVASTLTALPTNTPLATDILTQTATPLCNSFLATHVEVDPPYYGNSLNGNVRPQMDAYIEAFIFEDDSRPAQEVRELLQMIEDRKNPEYPDEYFDANNQFRARLDTFRYRVRICVQTGEWPSDTSTSIPAFTPTSTPTPTLTPIPTLTLTSTPTLGTSPLKVPEIVLQEVSHLACPDYPYPDNPDFYRHFSATDTVYIFRCSPAVGHGTSARLQWFSNEDDARAAFEDQRGSTVGKFHGFPLSVWEEDYFPGGRKEYRILLWQAHQWLIEVRAFDDTHYLIAPAPEGVSEAIYQVGLEHGLFTTSDQ
jgi:hypothetical protein